MVIKPFILKIEKLGEAANPNDLFFDPPVRNQPVSIDHIAVKVSGDPDGVIQIGIQNGIDPLIIEGKLISNTGEVLCLTTPFILAAGYRVFMRCLFDSSTHTRSMVVMGHYAVPD